MVNIRVRVLITYHNCAFLARCRALVALDLLVRLSTREGLTLDRPMAKHYIRTP